MADMVIYFAILRFSQAVDFAVQEHVVMFSVVHLVELEL